jgi:mono/diheme cytochrome c family protein
MKLQAGKLRLDILLLASSLLIIAAVVLAASPAACEDTAAGASVFKSKCVTCHGADGSGTAVGKSLQVADLRSPEVQSKSDAELTQAISDGKGNMPGFKGNISDDEIRAVLAHVRTLAAKGDSAPKKK